MSRRDTIWKWVFYTAGVLLLLLLQGLALDHISLLHVHPYLPPVVVAVLAMFEGAYGGMGVAVGRLRKDTLFDYKFVGLSHNTLRGAAGGAVLIAELLYRQGYLD